MLLPHQWTVLTYDEARFLVHYIEETTATKSLPVNYVKMGSKGILDLYNRLREFVEYSEHHDREVRNFNSDQYADREHTHLKLL